MQAFLSYWDFMVFYHFTIFYGLLRFFYGLLRGVFGGCIIECFDSKGEFLKFWGGMCYFFLLCNFPQNHCRSLYLYIYWF